MGDPAPSNRPLSPVQVAWDAGPVTDEPLFDALVRLAALLESHGEHGWSTWIGTDLRRLESGDAYALDHLLSAFGGMGSLSDLVLHPLNGHDIAEADLDASNQQLGALRTEVWSAATNLRIALRRRT